MERTTETDGLVRCLDCGARYRPVTEGDEVGPCPDCGGIGWVSLDAVRITAPDEDNHS